MKRTFGIAAALLLAVSGALWLRHDGGSPSTATPAVGVLRPPPGGTARAQTERRAPPGAPPAAEAPAPIPIASEPPTAPLAQAMTRRAYDSFGPQLADYLTRQGLSRVDAEPIVAELLDKTVTCALDALREQALEQRVDFDHVLNALDAELYDTDGPLITALLDVGVVGRRAMPCSMTALTQAGIPPQAASELFPRQSR